MCTDTDLRTTCFKMERSLRECRIRMLTDTQEPQGPRFFRLQLEADAEAKWCVSEVWMRGVMAM